MLDDLLGCTLVMREKGSGSRRILEDALFSRGLSTERFARTVELGSIGATKRLVERGLGIAFLYRACVAEEERMGRLAVIDLADFHVMHPVMFVYRRSSLFDDELRSLCAALCGEAGTSHDV